MATGGEDDTAKVDYEGRALARVARGGVDPDDALTILAEAILGARGRIEALEAGEAGPPPPASWGDGPPGDGPRSGRVRDLAARIAREIPGAEVRGPADMLPPDEKPDPNWAEVRTVVERLRQLGRIKSDDGDPFTANSVLRLADRLDAARSAATGEEGRP